MLIYHLLCRENGKGYVGQTKKPTAEDRFRVHIKNARAGENRAISQAIRDHGEDSFDITEIRRCSTEEELNEQEVLWIQKLGTLAPDGYNRSFGGKGPGAPIPETREKIAACKRGKPLPESVRLKISEAQRGRTSSPETCQKISAALKGRVNGPMSPEQVANMSGENGPSAKLNWQSVREIRQLSETGVSQRDIAERFSVCQMTVCNIINHKTWKE